MADIKNTFSKGLTVLNVKTSTFLEANKIKTYIATLSSEIVELKTEIGNLVYDEWAATGTISQEKIEEKLRLVNEKTELIHAQEEETARLVEKEKQILGAQEVKPDVPSAGGALPVSDAPVREAVQFCPGCGQGYAQPVKFCRKCGTKMS